MRKAVIFAVAIVLVAGLAYGQTPMKMAGYVNAGVNMPMGPDGFKDMYGMGLNGGIGFGIQPTEMFEFVGRFNYLQFALDEDFIAEEYYPGQDVTIDGGKVSGFEIAADVKFFPSLMSTPGPFKPYLIATIGFVNAKTDEATITGDVDEMIPEGESSTDLSYGIGAGFDYAVSPKVTVFAQAKYMIISEEEDDIKHLPINVGLKMFFGN